MINAAVRIIYSSVRRVRSNRRGASRRLEPCVPRRNGFAFVLDDDDKELAGLQQGKDGRRRRQLQVQIALADRAGVVVVSASRRIPVTGSRLVVFRGVFAGKQGGDGRGLVAGWQGADISLLRSAERLRRPFRIEHRTAVDGRNRILQREAAQSDQGGEDAQARAPAEPPTQTEADAAAHREVNISRGQSWSTD